MEEFENTTEQAAQDVSSQNGHTDKEFAGLPHVVIVGRPNTGKSTLFNRFMNERRAIVNPTRGVTRDAISVPCYICGQPVLLTDTGGFITGGSPLDSDVASRAFLQVDDADLILLVLERDVVTGEDEEVIAKLRPEWSKVICVVNKCEGRRVEEGDYNLAKYGFKSIHFISASHGDNISTLAKEIIARLDFSNVKVVGENKAIRIAILGKPNTGKSTLTNALVRQDISIVSSIAGTTRDVITGSFIYKGQRFTVCDTAGIRRRAKVNDDVEYYSVNRAIKALDECDIVFLMIDSSIGLTEQDKKICQRACENYVPVIFVLNKWDLVGEDVQSGGNRVPIIQTREFRKFAQKTRDTFAQMAFAPIVPLVAKAGGGVKTLLNEALDIFKQINTKVETNALNRALKDFISAHPAPAKGAAHFAMKYITQTSTNPVEFLIFVTNTECVDNTYLAYLQNKMRSELGLDKIPIKITLKASRTPWQERAAGGKGTQ